MREELKFAITTAQEAGKRIVEIYKSGDIGAQAKGPGDVVTAADYESEQIILGRIRNRYHKDKIFAEESGEHYAESKRMWCVDPLDGTRNFARGYERAGVVISLIEGEDITLSVVDMPFKNITYYAVHGEGAYKIQSNKKKILKVASRENPKECIFGFNAWGLRSSGVPREMGGRFFTELGDFLGGFDNIMHPGSNALELCEVAEGKLDGKLCLYKTVRPLDIPAALIAEEAGAKATNLLGRKWTDFELGLVVANPIIHKKLLKELKPEIRDFVRALE